MKGVLFDKVKTIGMVADNLSWEETFMEVHARFPMQCRSGAISWISLIARISQQIQCPDFTCIVYSIFLSIGNWLYFKSPCFNKMCWLASS
jgi:hypothetical protein